MLRPAHPWVFLKAGHRQVGRQTPQDWAALWAIVGDREPQENTCYVMQAAVLSTLMEVMQELT